MKASYDYSYLSNLIKKASSNWSGIDDADKWIDLIRGNKNIIKMEPKREEFEMKNLFIKKGIVVYLAALHFIEEDLKVKPILKGKIPIEPHEDLTSLLEMLKKPMAAILGLITTGPNPMQITGVSISGKGSTRGASIYAFYNGVDIRSGSIKFSYDEYGFERELENICDRLEDELFLFLYKNKRPKVSYLDIFSG